MKLCIGYSDIAQYQLASIDIIGCDDTLEPRMAAKTNPLTQQYEERAKNHLKAELKRRGIGYRELAEKLTAMGAPETDRNLANKISRGGFTAAFLFQCLCAIGCKTLLLEDG